MYYYWEAYFNISLIKANHPLRSTWLSKRGKVGAAVEVSLKEGYRHIDCAHVYENEAEVGEVMQKCFKEGVVQRDSLFVTSKLW